MSIVTIPLVPSASNQIQITTLDGTDYILRVLWNDRAGRHFLTVRDAANDDLITGFKLCADMPFAQHIVIDGQPAGQLWVRRPDNTGADPGLRDLNANVFLMYVESDSVT